ncbi:hypothetical protein KJ972_00245 [Candidatus Micrarchaeota archaeon]|nr:hypothetical protein [Candidatus Micrarchaeota archaeon]
MNCRFPPHQCGTNGFCEPTPCKKQRHCLEAGNYGYCARQHTCGDGRKDTGETCDPTAEITGCVGDYYCNSDCTQCINPGTTPNTCRDGILQEPQEECEVNIDCAIQSETCIEETCQCEQSVCVPFPAEPCLQPNPSSECYSTCSENSDCFTNYECQFNTCVPTWECGNNVLDAGEQCENVNELDVGTCDFDGTRTGTIQTCSNTCACVSGSTCRNGVLNAGEECDLENNRVVFSVAYTEGDSCSSACKRIDQFSCGTDNLVSENEDCDIIEVTPGEYSHEGNCNFDLGEYCIPSASIFDGAGIQSRGCTCLPPPGDLCCDTIVRPVEKCDPSNSQHGYCSFDDPYFEECIGCQCGTQPVCDNGIPESGETCGEPGLSCAPGEDCINCQCIPSSTTCGDGIADPGEECNEPELPPCNATETCVNCQCVSPTQACGNGIPESGETCGEPELPSCPTGESCNSATCQCEPACGNGIADPNEECDFIFGLGEQGCTQEYYCLPPTIASGANKCTCTLRPLDPKIVIRQIEIQPLNHQPGKTLEQVSVTIQNVGKQSCTSGTIKISVTTADNASLDLSATSNSFSLDSLEANIINFLSAPSTPTLPNTSTLKSGAYSIITSVYCDSTLQDQKNAFFSIGGSTYAAIPETNLILVLLIGLVIVVLINQKQK